jgi:hypothetical protein
LVIGNNASVIKPISPRNKVVLGAAMKFAIIDTTTYDLICFKDGNQTQVRVEYVNNNLRITGPAGVLATGNTFLANGTVHFIEFMATIAPSIAANSCVLRIDGVVDCVAPAGASTQATGNASVNRIQIASSGFGTVGVTLSDVHILDGLGAVNNGLLGDRKVEVIRPDAAGGLSEWTAVGAADGWECVDDTVHDGDATYVASLTPGQYSTFGLTDLPSGVPAIDGVLVRTTARKDDAGSRTLALALEVGGTRYDGVALALIETYAVLYQGWDLNPATSAGWTESDINALGAGVKLVS